MRYTNLLLLTLLSCITFYGYSQQEAQYTQYLDNMQHYNPAYVGSREMMNVTALHRQQWAGFKGAPMTTSIAMHTPLSYKSIGVGLSIMNDMFGPLRSNAVNLDFSYSFKLAKPDAKLSIGLKGGANFLNGDLAGMYKEDASDALLNGRYQNEVTGNVGAGVYYSSKRFFAGLSVPRIMVRQKPSNDFSQFEYIDQRHYYFSIGGYFTLNRMIKLRPSALFKYTSNAPFALDLSVACIIYDKVWVGANYRIAQSAGLILQYQLTNLFKLGYAFEYSTGKIRSYNGGTHEINLTCDMLFKSKQVQSPRYF